MLIPYNTDAPLFYYPIATAAIMVVNIFVFTATLAGSIDPGAWMLQYGNGLDPLQWISSSFLHTGVGHLVGNIFFLWAFGLVVEGKLGTGKFLACYFGISLVQGLLEQLVMLGYHGETPGSLGASAVIFGIMAMAVIWAPKNELNCLLLIIWWPILLDIPILAFATFFVCLQLLAIMLVSDASSWLHLSGFLIGLPLGVVLLKRNFVDCEEWDIFHVLSGNYGAFKNEPDPEEISAELARRQRRRDEKQLQDADAQLQAYLEQGNARAALILYEKMKAVGDGLSLDRRTLLSLIRGLHANRRWAESAPFMAEFIRRFPEGADPVRIKLAQVSVLELSRPGKALELLGEVQVQQLQKQQLALAKQIARKARQMQADGTLELDQDEW